LPVGASPGRATMGRLAWETGDFQMQKVRLQRTYITRTYTFPGKRALDHPAALEDTKATGTDLLPIHFDPFRDPNPSQAAPGMFDDLDVPPQLRLDPLAEAFLLVSAIGPDQLETRKDPLERRKQGLAAASVLDVGFMHQHVQNQPICIDEQMALTAFDLLAAVIAAGPPFWVVLTD